MTVTSFKMECRKCTSNVFEQNYKILLWKEKAKKENEQRCNLPTFLLQFWVQNHQLRRMRNDERSEKG